MSTGPLRFRLRAPEERPDANNGFPDVGIVLNVSDSGLCFITTRSLEEGQTLVIQCPWLMDKDEEGTVRWCRKEAIDLWRVDVQRKNIRTSTSSG